jgi:RNA polymerase sigma-70 factor (ECF subfamily)
MSSFDPSLVQAMKDGDSRALDQFYRVHAKVVLAWVIRLGGPRMDAEDVAQEVFVIALKRIHTFRGESKVTTWLFAITRNVVNNRRRRLAIRRFVGMDRIESLPDENASTDEHLHRKQQRKLVQSALECLPQKQREVIVLMDLEERSANEASDMLGVPPGTIYSRLHYARKAFTSALKSQNSGKTWGMLFETTRDVS